jgi:hypothetical protein
MKKHYHLLALLTITALVGLITSHAGAAERKPSKADYKSLEDIKKNQICLHDNRQPFTRITNSFRNKEKVDPKDIPSYNRFVDCKTWNALEVSELNKNGWNVRWDTMELVDSQTTPAAPSKSNAKASTSVQTVGKAIWKLEGGTAHQKSILKQCQERLVLKGVTDPEALKYGCSIYLAENERMDPLRLGDAGHAFGLCQKNLGRKSAQAFLDANPEWKTVDVQLDYCTSRFAKAWKRYGNVFQATVEHNSPAAAAGKRDACHISPCYFVRVQNKASLLSL